jgi:hypothetical protein
MLEHMEPIAAPRYHNSVPVAWIAPHNPQAGNTAGFTGSYFFASSLECKK